MAVYYIKRAHDILRKEGIVKLAKDAKNYLLWNQLASEYKRFQFHTRKNDFINTLKYDKPPIPEKPIIVDTTDIKYRIKKDKKGDWVFPSPKYGGLGQISGGDWDNIDHREEVEDIPIIAGYQEYIIEKKDWKETTYYEWLYNKRKQDKKYKQHGYTDLTVYLDDYFKQYTKLYEEIQNQGYKQNHKDVRKDPGKREAPNVRDILEVLVSIDRNGNIHLTDGHNRFGIARALGLEIPVHVVCRHRQWQQLRDDIWKDKLSKNDIDGVWNHPDLQDVTS